MAEDYVVAVDLGGTNIRAALCSAEGVLRKRTRQLTLPEQGVEAVIERICDSVHAVLPDLDTDAPDQVRAVGVASPGSLDPFSGTVLVAANLFWSDVALRDMLHDRLNLPICVGNDANLAALGEHRYGAGRGVRDLVYVTISTGIGAGVILNGQLVLGRRGLAAEVGHMAIDCNGAPDAAGVPGALEGYAAGPGIARMAQERLQAGYPSTMRDLVGGNIAAITAREVGEAAKLGDALALDIVQRVARILGLGLVNVLHLFDPALIIVGGSVALIGDLLLDPVRATIQRYAMPPYRDVPIVPAALGDDCGLLGAAALAWQHWRGSTQLPSTRRTATPDAGALAS